MLGVLIVDDEVLSRIELKSMIDWENEGFYILGEAENGKKGLELILRDKPDIVITDIKMPVMDGLEMIKLAKKQYDDARYVILSSYEEFALLKTAMHYNVADYLLKLECSPDLLRQTLRAQKSELVRTREIAADGKEPPPISRVTRMLRQALSGQNPDESITRELARVNPTMDPDRLSCISILFSLPRNSSSFIDSDRYAMEVAAQNIVDDIAKNFYPGISFMADTGLCLFLFTPSGGSHTTAEMGGIVINMLRQYLNVESSVGVIRMVKGWREIPALLSEAAMIVEEVFFQNFGRVLEIPTHRELLAREDSAYFDWPEALLSALETCSKPGVSRVFQSLAGTLEDTSRLKRVDAYNLCLSVVGVTLSVLKKNSDSKGFFDENLYEVIRAIDTLEGLREWLSGFKATILELFDCLPEKSGEDYIVAEAKRYIAENYREAINLNVVANYLSISSGYLCSIFKKKTNIGFAEYVTKIKFLQAKRMLLSGQYKVYEVSELIGYEDTSYFIKKFRKITGVTPKEFIARNS